jgi:outer membrane protein assembly factor BamB
MKRVLFLLAIAILFTACSRNDETINEPMALGEIDRRVQASRLWSSKLGDLAGEKRLALAPTLEGDRIYAGDHEGELRAIDADNGRRVWSVDTDERFSAGPGANSARLVMGTLDGVVIAYDAASGAELWRHRINSEILARPAVTDSRVIVRSINGTTTALNAESGEQVWSTTADIPALTLRGNAPPLVRAGVVVLAYDNGRVAALNLDTGEPLWEHLISEAGGRGELERLNDADGAMAWVGANLYVVNFQGRLVSLNASAGSSNWMRDFSSYQGLSADRTSLFITDAESEVWAVDRRSGASLWRQDGLKYRRLTTPTAVAGVVAVADLDGYLHFLDYDSGSLVGRVNHSGSPVRSELIGQGDRLYVMDSDGRLSAWRVQANNE